MIYRRIFLLIAIMLIICTFAGCGGKDLTVISDETSEPISTSEVFISSVDKISSDIDLYMFAYSGGVWGEGEYNALCICFNDSDAEYYEVVVDGEKYTVMDRRLYLDEKFLNKLIKSFKIDAFDWEGNILHESAYKNVMFFSPQWGSNLDDILYLKDDLAHLWVTGPENNRDGVFETELSLALIGEFNRLETLCLGYKADYVDFDPNDIGKLNRLHTLHIQTFINNTGFLSELPLLNNLSLWIGEAYEYTDIGEAAGLKELEVLSSSISEVKLLDNFINLEKLEIQSRSLRVLSNISNLASLEDLTLIYPNALDDSSIVSVPASLKRLSVFAGEREDYSFLEAFNTVEELCIIDSDISDLSFLALYNNLKKLDLRDSYSALHQDDAVEYIKEKTGLTTLLLPLDYYNYCTICNDGTNMDIDDKIRDVSFLEGMTNLETLVIDIEDIDDISAIMDKEKLTSLTLANASDISMLAGHLEGLNSLTLLHTTIMDFAPLSHLKNLRYLYMYENYAVNSEGYDFEYPFDFSFLTRLARLKYICLYNFDMFYLVKDDTFPDLGSLNDLVYLEFGSLECSDISGIFNAVNIEQLVFFDCIIPGLQGIENLDKLYLLNLSWAEVDDETREMLAAAFGDQLIILE